MRVEGIAGALVVAAVSLATTGVRRVTLRQGMRRSLGAPTAHRPRRGTTNALTRGLLVTDGMLSSRFPSFHAIQTPVVVRAAGVWTAEGGLPGYQGQLQTARLDRLGFVAGVRQSIYAGERSSAQLTSIAPFVVHGIRGAVGYDNGHRRKRRPHRGVHQRAVLLPARRDLLRQPNIRRPAARRSSWRSPGSTNAFAPASRSSTRERNYDETVIGA